MGASPANDGPSPPPAAEWLWIKITDPEADIPAASPGADIRVLIPDDPRFVDLRHKLAANDIPTRQVKHLIEEESIQHRGGRLSASVWECRLGRPSQREFPHVSPRGAQAARDAFSLLWDISVPTEPAASQPVAAADVVPTDWLGCLPHPTLNPAQLEAIPPILDGAEHLVVVAPTGAGKTVMGMVAALRTMLGDGRKAAWLVPQRSLTEELNRELDEWRRQGLRVERLSGEHRVDLQRVRDADLWVATTEKFEAMCRASSLREALAEVSCLIVDEIHLLGDPERGPVLEALLTRVRSSDARMRIIGLSATVSNAEEIAAWLGAQLIRLTWRPSRLTWQLPVIAAHDDWNLVETARIRLASAITAMVTGDEGSVLVFCGSKRNVRRTALVIAGSRGANVDGVHPDDLDRLHAVCERVGVGLHYKGWEHRHEAEEGFRAKRLDVLVATSTVAAGVNLPARAVIVQDTEVGMKPVDVATVQQMFGRAGRVGAGEREGWAFMLVTDRERPVWHSKLVAGYTVASQIQSSLADHVLAEAVQRRIGSLHEAEQWWLGTLAHHQGNRSIQPLRSAVGFLLDGGFLACDEAADSRFLPTELGKLTARLMVSANVGRDLVLALTDAALPEDPDQAELTVIGLVSALVPGLAQTAINEELKTIVNRLLRPDAEGGYQPGDLAKVALGLVAASPETFHRGTHAISGIPYQAMYSVLEEAPRYLHWLGCLGPLGTVHPWSAMVAADLSRRVKWRRCQPRRGSGRLLWMCEQMATAAHAEEAVPLLWRAATTKGLGSPDWTATGRPRHCHLDHDDYQQLLSERATSITIDRHANRTNATAPDGSVLVTWSGRRHQLTSMPQGKASLPDPDADGMQRDAAVFTWRGDYRATGWLQRYSQQAREDPANNAP